MKKRLISLALVLVLALSLLPVAALAADYDDFADLKKDVWYTPYINFVLEKGYFIGMSDTEFAPNANMTRAMFVTVIARMEGVEVDDNAATQFEDVKTGVWYTGSVAWAAANGIVEGYEDGSFRPGNNVTRREMAAIMARYIAWVEENTNKYAVESDKNVVFADQAEIDAAAWAKEAVATCVNFGLLEGYPDGTFGGKRNSTRAEVAAVIERLALLIKEVNPDYIYLGVKGVMDTLTAAATLPVVKAEELSDEYISLTSAAQLADLSVSDVVDASAVIGENVDGTRLVSVKGSATLNESAIYNTVKFAATYAAGVYADKNVLWEDVKAIVDAIVADVNAIDFAGAYELVSDKEAVEIAEFAYNTVKGGAYDLWAKNFKGENGYYTGNITVKVGDYSSVIVVNDETGVSIPTWKQDAVGFGVALAKEVVKSFLAQAKDYTSSLTNIGATIDVTFSAGAYKETTDLYAYNYPVEIALSFVNNVDTFQYKIDNGLFVKAYISEAVQAEVKEKANAALTKIMESETFQNKFNPAVEQAKESEEFTAIVDVIAEAQGEEAANKIVDGYVEQWAKDNAESKLTGDGEWKNESIYDLAYIIGGEIYGYVETELDARGLEMKPGITPEQLKENMTTAGVEIEVDAALENYVLGVICDKNNEEKGVETTFAEEAAPAMKEYVDTTVPATLEENDNFSAALELAEKVRTALESTDNLCAVRFGNLATVLRNETVQELVAVKGADSVVAKFAKYIEKAPAKASVVIAGCTINEAAVIAVKDATTVAELCNAVADILEETGLADLTLADFAPEAGQNISVAYGDKSATVLNIVVEFEK